MYASLLETALTVFCIFEVFTRDYLNVNIENSHRSRETDKILQYLIRVYEVFLSLAVQTAKIIIITRFFFQAYKTNQLFYPLYIRTLK